MHCTEKFHLNTKGRGLAEYVCASFFNQYSKFLNSTGILQAQTPRVNCAEIALS
jgi:hypothetical protein